jgi:hypothetical protein
MVGDIESLDLQYHYTITIIATSRTRLKTMDSLELLTLLCDGILSSPYEISCFYNINDYKG